ncbi:MAG TPA: queuosine salvage family protein [Baekduia sp.]|uniref:queuosine salvage family protein n=1 Tax=Baekduia sp. TaxID=2600305 RepID=UPI002BF0B8D7|nr:queuosine salvage family protein [Baekduia sp.]HMJ37420.1 queuosine salvage family protein [Baekduia sp.]
MGLTDDVRAACAQIAEHARSVRIDAERLAGYGAGADGAPVTDPGLDPVRHYLEGSPADVALYTLALDTINFGSGWFPTLSKRSDPAAGRTVSGYFTIAWNLADHFRIEGPWTTQRLRTMRTEDLAAILGQPADHELMSLYSQALRELGRFLGTRSVPEVIAEARGSAERLATMLASGMAFYDDRGFYKRAQIAGNDLALAGVARFHDLDRLTIFADNLVPHVLRCDGVLVYEPALAARIDAGELLPAGGEEREIRACALHACEQLGARLDVAPRVLDMWLWNRGQAPALKARPRHRTRTVYY